MGVILGTAFGQLEAMEESVYWNLSGNALRCNDLAHVDAWLRQQGLEPVVGPDNAGMMISSAMDACFYNQAGDSLGVYTKVAQKDCATRVEEIGKARSGAGWRDPATFIITSAFVRLLGALEQYELDVLKALLYYRPAGALGAPGDQEMIDVTLDVLIEQPVVSNGVKYFQKPALWTWIRALAENNVERRKIFDRVFDLKCVREGKLLDQWYEKRNAIAHGRSRVEMTLREFVDVEVFVARTMWDLADQCRTKLKLAV